MMSQRLRIVCAIHGLSGGGAEHLMAGLASRLSERHDVTLLTLANVTTDRYSVSPAVHRRALDLVSQSDTFVEGLRANWCRLRGLRRAVCEVRPDVVIAFCDQLNIAISLALTGMHTPLIVAEMTDPRFHPLPRVWRWLRPWAYRRATAAVAISEASRATVTKFHGRAARLIPPAVDEPPTEIVVDHPATGRFRLAALGRLAAEKRFDWLIRAFAELSAEFPDWDLEIAGDGPLRGELEQLIGDLKQASRIRLRGRIPEVWGFLSGATAWAMTSRYEGTPVALLEALRLGLPTLSLKCDSGIGELIRSEENGLLVDAEPASLVAGLRRLLSSGELRQRLSQAAPATAAQYNWDTFVQRYEELACECLSRRAIKGVRTHFCF
jgi:GalNAc-alpha-(1->4)-GalNAc-alpha-(1->3)-diNAcBac-PP-undecaprenol alpha-1,4-N-acetyl-D-galactosaminyltransferase